MTEEQKQTTEALLAERMTTHGEYTEHARCTQRLLRVLMAERRYEELPDTMKESLHLICHKMARVVTGNPNHADHWDDIAGYAKLISQRLSPDFKVDVREAPLELDLYTHLSAVWGVTRQEAKLRVLRETFQGQGGGAQGGNGFDRTDINSGRSGTRGDGNQS
jgi:hypothetical protein